MSTATKSKILTEVFPLELRLSVAEYRIIQEMAEASEWKFDDVVNAIIHRYLHTEAEFAVSQSRDQDERMEQLRHRLRIEYATVWDAFYKEE